MLTDLTGVRPPYPPAPRRATRFDAARAEKANRRIIVADDNADYAESTAIILRMEGHEVHTAYDGMQTVELCDALRPEVVLLDIGLPKLNGYEAARRIRAMAGMERALLVAISGWGQRRDRELAQAAGFDKHLVKPEVRGWYDNVMNVLYSRDLELVPTPAPGGV